MTPEAVVEFAEALANIAAGGGGAKALTAHLAAVSGGGVLLEDVQWRHIAAAGSERMPASARAVVESRAAGHTVQVCIGDLQLAWLSVFTNGEERGQRERIALLMRVAASAIGVELARELDGGRGRRRMFWERILAGAYHDANAAHDDAAARGIALAPAYLTIALEAESTDPATARAELPELRTVVAEAFRSSDADLGFFERGAALLVFVPALREIDASNARVAATLLPKTLAKRKTQLRLSGGVGTVEAPLNLPASAAKAEAALAIGRRIHGAGRIAAYDELGAYPLLYEGADANRLQSFAERVLRPLRAYDEKHQTELERTLKLYFAVGQNVKTAAAQLNVHRHTVFYRLRQIGEICASSLESPHDQLTLRLAVAIDALHTNRITPSND
jgi:PucR family transcriptional regulator, purine catabolism regulatory protein